MRLTYEGVKSIVKKKKGGAFYEALGPFQFSGARIWETWVDDGTKDSEYWETRFIVEHDDEPLYFDSFGALCAYLNEIYLIAAKDVGAFDLTRMREIADLQRKNITLYVGAFVFTSTVLAMLFIVVWKGETQSLIALTLLGVIASGAALFFGRWIPISSKTDAPNTNGTRTPRLRRKKPSDDDTA